MRLIWNNQVPAANLREQWNALVFQMEKPEVFYTWEWATAVARVYGEIQEPWIATAYEGDELVGVAALARASTSAKEAAFLACTTADYCDFISLPQKRQEFVAHVFHDLKQAGTQRVVLANLPADSTTVAELKVSKSFRSFFRTGYMCAQVRLGSPEERRLLTDSLLKKKMFRRSVNTLSRIGPVMLQHDLGAGLPRGVIEKFCLTHVARFLGTGRVSNLVHPERRKFLSVLAALLAERKCLT
jgi:CelD/BcsL family acetyltransferase involved in cellulose biosynthesis